MKRTIIVFVLSLCLTTVVSYAEESSPLEIPGDVPDVYVVKEGDTLWDIAEHFFGDPQCNRA